MTPRPPRRRLVPGAWARAALGLFLCLATGCASTRPLPTLPQGPGAPYAGHAEALAEAVRACRGVRTMEFLLALGGRSGETRLRGRVRGALARPASLRLEGLSPFGAPRFVLAATPDDATLVLPRSREVVRDAPPSEMLRALAGLPLGADDLRAVLTGCVVPDPQPVAGRAWDGGWIAVELAGGDATAYLRPVDGAPAVVAATRGGMTLEYAGHVRGLPRRVRVQAPATDSDLTADLTQLRINTPLHPEVFELYVSGAFTRVPLEALTGTPLRERAEPADGVGSFP